MSTETMKLHSWREVSPAITQTVGNVANRKPISVGKVDYEISYDGPLDSGYGTEFAEAAKTDQRSKGISYAGEVPVPPKTVPADFQPFPTMP